MKNKNSIHDLITHFIKLKKYNFQGNVVQNKICFYDIKNNAGTFDILKSEIKKITTKFNFVVCEPKEQYTQINILDIDL